MRVQPHAKPPRARSDLRDRKLSRGRLVLLLSAAALTLLLLAVAGIWYRLEGRQIVRQVLDDLSRREGADVVGLSRLHLDLTPQAYKALEDEWHQAGARGVLRPDEQGWPQGEIRFEGRTMPVRTWIAPPGENTAPETKWPLLVRVEGDASLLGMRAFSLHPPAGRGYLDEWLFFEELRRAGILAPRCAWVNVLVNGQDWGAYALVERISEPLFESQGRRGGLVVRLSGGLPGVLQPAASGPLVNLIEGAMALPAVARVDDAYAGRLREDPALGQQAVTALGLLRAFQEELLQPSEVFDAQLMGRYIAHTELWGVGQGPTRSDEAYYYNPVTGRLEPVGQDMPALVSRYALAMGPAQYDDLAIMRAYVQEALQLSQPAYVETMREAYAAQLDRYWSALAHEYPTADLDAPWDALAERQASLLAALHPSQTVHAYLKNSTSPEGGAEVRVSNLLPYPVTLHQLRVGERTVEVRGDWVDAKDAALVHAEARPSPVLRRAQGTVPRYVTLHVPSAAIPELLPAGGDLSSSRAQIITSLYGMEERVEADVLVGYPPALTAPALPVRPTVEQALARYPFLEKGDRPGFLTLKGGTWPVAGDLVLPQGLGLWASEPTTLTFDSDAVFLSSGPLVLHGPEGEGIHLLPKAGSWAGVIVLGTGPNALSSLSNVEIRATRGISRRGWIAPAGVTFYESAVVLDGCRLTESTARHAIQVVRAPFRFSDTEFSHASAGAFDGGWTRGRIERCAFHDIVGSAVTLTGSDVALQDVDLLRVYGQGVSAGEGSVATVQGLRATDIGLALVSKDSSYLHARDVHLYRVAGAGFAAYESQPGAGPASIEASMVVFQEDDFRQALVQPGSRVTINGLDIPATEFGLDELVGGRGKELPDGEREGEEEDQEEEEESERATAQNRALPPMRVLNYRLGPNITLVGYNLARRAFAPGEVLPLTLYWRALSQPPLDYTVFVHVLDAEGQNVAGWDSMPRDNAFPTTEWPVRQLIDDLHLVPLPADLPTGEYQVALGMYYYPSGERLPIVGPDGSELPNAALVLDKIEVE